MVSVPQILFVEFVADLQSLLEAIHSKTKSVYIPIAIQISPVNPSKDFVVVFRNSASVKCIPLRGWFTEKIPDLAKKFTHKIESIAKKDVQGVKFHLNDKLKAWYKDENLKLIGGF